MNRYCLAFFLAVALAGCGTGNNPNPSGNGGDGNNTGCVGNDCDDPNDTFEAVIAANADGSSGFTLDGETVGACSGASCDIVVTEVGTYRVDAVSDTREYVGVDVTVENDGDVVSAPLTTWGLAPNGTYLIEEIDYELDLDTYETDLDDDGVNEVVLDGLACPAVITENEFYCELDNGGYDEGTIEDDLAVIHYHEIDDGGNEFFYTITFVE